MGDNELSGKVGLDTTDFKTAISTLNREIRVVESGFRAAAAGLGDWGKSASGLESRIKALNSEIELQQRKVFALRDEYERVAAEKGENSRAAQDLEIKLNKETEALGKMTSEVTDTEVALEEMRKESDQAGDEVEDTGEQTKKAGDEAKKAGGKFEGFGKMMDGVKAAAKATAAMVAGLGLAVIGVGVAVAKLVTDQAKAADNIVESAEKIGISTKQYQEFAFIAGQIGMDVETLGRAFSRTTIAIREAGEAGSPTAEIFDKLGISARDANGNFKSTSDIFGEIITALGNIDNETERDIITQQLFGKSFQELKPLINLGAEGMEDLTTKANDMGAVIGEDDVTALANFNDTLDGMKAGLAGTMGTLSAAVLPAFEGLASTAGEYLGRFTNLVKNTKGNTGKLAAGIGNIVGDIVKDIAEQAPALLEAGLGILQGIITAITANLPVIIPAVIKIMTSLVTFLLQNIPILIQAGLDIILMLAQGILAALPNIIAVIIEIIPQIITTLGVMLPQLILTGIQLLVAIIDGLAQALPQIIPAIVGIIPTIITTLLENLPLLIGAALDLILALAEGLIAALPSLISAVPTILQALIDAIVAALPMIATAALALITALATGIVENLPLIGEKAAEIIGILGQGIIDVAIQIAELGRTIVEGIVDGITGSYDWFMEQFGAFFGSIIEAIKKLLGIASGSKVFAAEIGENLAAGIGEGFTGQMEAVRKQIAASVASLSGSASFNVAAGAGGSQGGADAIRPNKLEVTVNIQGGTGMEQGAARTGVMAAARELGLV